jgi:hypothetical protein
MPIDTLIVLFIVCAVFVCIFLLSAPGEKFMKALKRLTRLGNGERRNSDG